MSNRYVVCVQFTLEAGNSEARGVRLTAGVWGARCAASPPDPPHPPAPTASSRTAANGKYCETGNDRRPPTVDHTYIRLHHEVGGMYLILRYRIIGYEIIIYDCPLSWQSIGQCDSSTITYFYCLHAIIGSHMMPSNLWPPIIITLVNC